MQQTTKNTITLTMEQINNFDGFKISIPLDEKSDIESIKMSKYLIKEFLRINNIDYKLVKLHNSNIPTFEIINPKPPIRNLHLPPIEPSQNQRYPFVYACNTQSNHDNNSKLFVKACKLHVAGKYDEAIEIFLELSKSFISADCLFNVACGYSRKGDLLNALTYLRQSIEKGYFNFHSLMNDKDLDSLRLHPEFQNICNKLKPKKDSFNDSSSSDDEDSDSEEDTSLNNMFPDGIVSSRNLFDNKNNNLVILDSIPKDTNLIVSHNLSNTKDDDDSFFSTKVIGLSEAARRTQKVIDNFDGKHIGTPFGLESGHEEVILSCKMIEQFLDSKNINYEILETFPPQYRISKTY